MANITIKVWAPMLNDDPRSCELVATIEGCKTLREARRRAKVALNPYRKVTTWETRGYGPSAPWADIERGGKCVETIEGVDYVDSIATRLRRGESVAV